MRQDYQRFQERETEIIAVGPDSREKFSTYFQANNLPFPGIADPRHDLANSFGQEVNWLKLGRMPEVVVVDKTGVIKYVHYANSMADIPGSDELLAHLA